MQSDPVSEHWTLDRKVPVAIIITLLVQFVAYTWYAAKLDSRVEEQATRISRAEAQITTIDREAREVNTRLARFEEKMTAMLAILQRLERAVEVSRP